MFKIIGLLDFIVWCILGLILMLHSNREEAIATLWAFKVTSVILIITLCCLRIDMASSDMGFDDFDFPDWRKRRPYVSYNYDSKYCYILWILMHLWMDFLSWFFSVSLSLPEWSLLLVWVRISSFYFSPQNQKPPMACVVVGTEVYTLEEWKDFKNNK